MQNKDSSLRNDANTMMELCGPGLCGGLIGAQLNSVYISQNKELNLDSSLQIDANMMMEIDSPRS